MGPEVRFKSARRCQGIQNHQGYHHINSSIGNQPSSWDSRVFRMFFNLFGFLSWKLFMQYGGSQALRTHADLVTIIVTYLFISAIVTGISFIDFKLFFYIVINQSITIAIKILLLSHFSAFSPHRGDPLTVPRLHTSVRQTAATQNSKNKSITSFNCGFPSVPPRRSNQSKLPIKRDMHIHMRLRHHRHWSYQIQRAPDHMLHLQLARTFPLRLF